MIFARSNQPIPMSYDWKTSDVVPPQDLQGPDIWNQHIAAIQERLDRIAPGELIIWHDDGIVAALATSPPVQAGTDINVFGWWSHDGRPSFAGVSSPAPVGMQTAVESMIPSCVIPTTVIEGITAPFNGDFSSISWTMPKLRAAYPGPLRALYNRTTLPLFASTVVPPPFGLDDISLLPTNDGWLRRRPREVYGTLDPLLYDVVGNPNAVNAVAWSYYPVTPPALGSGAGLFQWDGAKWNPLDIASPHFSDVISNEFDFPNTIPLDTSSLYDTGATMGVGPGDYIGDWLFVEVRAATNPLRWTMYRTSLARPLYSANVTSSVSYADALSKLAAAWAPGDAGGLGEPFVGVSNGGSGAYIEAIYSGGVWQVCAQRWSSTQDFTASPLTAHAKQVLIYQYAAPAPNADPLTSLTSPPTFDAQGDPVLNGQFHLVFDSGVTSSTAPTCPKIGDETTLPPNAPPDPQTHGDSALGYQTLETAILVKYDVAGGLSYVF